MENGDLKELLRPFPARRMKIWPISSRVNSPDNDDEGILEPVEPVRLGKFTQRPDPELPLE